MGSSSSEFQEVLQELKSRILCTQLMPLPLNYSSFPTYCLISPSSLACTGCQGFVWFFGKKEGGEGSHQTTWWLQSLTWRLSACRNGLYHKAKASPQSCPRQNGCRSIAVFLKLCIRTHFGGLRVSIKWVPIHFNVLFLIQYLLKSNVPLNLRRTLYL